MKRSVLLLSVFVLAVSMVGCRWEKAPKGFPKTVPFKIIVTSESNPVADATVMMTPTERNNSWSVTGKTDASGTAQLHTVQGAYLRAGVPLGKFHVTITKLPDVASMTTTVNDGTPGGAAAYAAEVARLREENPSEIPLFMNSLDSSPLETEVAKGTKEFKIEVTEYSELDYEE